MALVAQARGGRFVLSGGYWIGKRRSSMDDTLYHAATDLYEWLGFEDRFDYLAALRREGPRIFLRAVDSPTREAGCP